MCRATVSHCIDCKGEYWEINEELCWRKYERSAVPRCSNIILHNIVELREAAECAKCKGLKESRWLRYSKPPGLVAGGNRNFNVSTPRPNMYRPPIVFWEEREAFERQYAFLQSSSGAKAPAPPSVISEELSEGASDDIANADFKVRVGDWIFTWTAPWKGKTKRDRWNTHAKKIFAKAGIPYEDDGRIGKLWGSLKGRLRRRGSKEIFGRAH